MAQLGSSYRTSPRYIKCPPVGKQTFFQSSVTGTFEGVNVIEGHFYVKLGIGNGQCILQEVGNGLASLIAGPNIILTPDPDGTLIISSTGGGVDSAESAGGSVNPISTVSLVDVPTDLLLLTSAGTYNVQFSGTQTNFGLPLAGPQQGIYSLYVNGARVDVTERLVSVSNNDYSTVSFNSIITVPGPLTLIQVYWRTTGSGIQLLGRTLDILKVA